jgi:hypothetical protein
MPISEITRKISFVMIFLAASLVLVACGGGGGGGDKDRKVSSSGSGSSGGGSSPPAPVLDAKNYSTTTSQGTAVLVYPLSNDTGVNDPSLVVELVSQPSNGTAVLQPDNSVLYTPDSGFVGTDTFTYRITLASGATDTAKVSIIVDNGPACAYTVGLSWNNASDPSIAGYYIYHGTTSGVHPDKVYVGLVFSHDYCLSTPGQHYFAASSVNTIGIESSLSAEVGVTIP